MANFLIVSLYFPPEVGAAQMRLESFARALQDLGNSVEVVTAMPSYPTGSIFLAYRGRWISQEQWNGIPVIRSWAYPAKGKGVRRLLNYLSFIPSAFMGLMRASRADYIFVETPPLFGFFPARIFAKRWSSKVIVNVADLWIDAAKEFEAISNPLLLNLAYSLEKQVYAKADWVSAVTVGIFQSLVNHKGVPAHKVLFLPNGVDTDLLRPAAHPTPMRRANKGVILYTGSLGYIHGVETLLETARVLREEPVHFLIVGDGSERENLILQSHLKNCSNIDFVDPLPHKEIAQLYDSAVAGVVMLRKMSLNYAVRPAKMLTIMACGKPVLYSGEGEGADIVRQAEAGIVVPPEDPGALAHAILYLIRHPDEAHQMGMNGRRFVEQNFSWRQLVKRWLSELEQKERIYGGA